MSQGVFLSALPLKGKGRASPGAPRGLSGASAHILHARLQPEASAARLCTRGPVPPAVLSAALLTPDSTGFGPSSPNLRLVLF